MQNMNPHIVGTLERDIFSRKHDIYPLIDPTSHFASKTYTSKVVLITGGATGIGAHTALYYARSGAAVVLVSRRLEKLEEAKKDIEDTVNGAEVLILQGDVSELEVGKRVVKEAVERWGRVDIVIANSAVGMGSADRLGDRDPIAWWYTQEVNIHGTLNIIHPAIPELLKTKGHIIITTSGAAHMRLPFMSDYIVSKHAIDRLAEILALDYPELSVTAFNPGAIATPGALEAQAKTGIEPGSILMPDTIDLPAATCLWLTDPANADVLKFLSGRYVEASWDLNEVLAKKEEIVRDNLLVTKLAGPK